MKASYFLALPMMLAPLSGCGSADDAGNAAAPPPTSNTPAPRTPVMEITPAPGNQAEWMAPPSNAADPTRAPYSDVLNDPVVNAPSKR